MASTVAERREHWRGVVEQWRQSGRTKAAFCREHGLALWQFYYWCGRPEGTGGGGSNGGFARVHSVDASGVRLRLGAGLELEIEPGFDEGTLRQVLRVLGATC